MKNEPEASEVPHLPHWIIIMSQIKSDDSFAKRGFRPFQNVVQIHQILRLPHEMAAKTTSHLSHACQRFSSVRKVPRLPHGWKSAQFPTPVTQNEVVDHKMSRKRHVTQNGHSSKNEHGALVKRDLRKRGLRGHHSVKLPSKTEDEGTLVL